MPDGQQQLDLPGVGVEQARELPLQGIERLRFADKLAISGIRVVNPIQTRLKVAGDFDSAKLRHFAFPSVHQSLKRKWAIRLHGSPSIFYHKKQTRTQHSTPTTDRNAAHLTMPPRRQSDERN
jgi:hypothetical protein